MKSCEFFYHIKERYESEPILEQYLLFHYGNEKDQMPFSFGPRNSLQFPVRCVSECLDLDALPLDAKALELGCAVGRSSFELARYCKRVLAIDNSHAFITAAKQIQEVGQLKYTIMGEGNRKVQRIAKLPSKIDPNRVEFRCCDAMDIFQTTSSYHAVLAANLLCRLNDPLTFLKLLPTVIAPNGQLVLTSPYSWLEEFTPRSRWIGGKRQHYRKSALELIKEALGDWFFFKRAFDLPFLIREHLRKYEWGVAQASVWKRNNKVERKFENRST